MPGWIYIMSNASMPGLLKIGRSSQDPQKYRSAELNAATGVPIKFFVEYQALVRDEVSAEAHLHRRYVSNRYGKEFFSDLSVSEVVATVRRDLEVLFDQCFGLSDEDLERMKKEAHVQKVKEKYAEIARKLNETKAYFERNHAAFLKYEKENEMQTKKEHNKISQILRPKPLPSMRKWLGNDEPYIRYQKSIVSFTLDAPCFGWGVFEDGSVYAGTFKTGARHGHGTCRFSNGDYYTGNWSAGKMSGLGRLVWTGQDEINGFHIGNFTEGKMDGWGYEKYEAFFEEIDMKVNERFYGVWKKGERIEEHLSTL